MASSSSFSGKELYKRIPMKKISEMVLTESVKTSGTDLLENWTGESAVRRIENEFTIFDALTEFIVDLTEEEGGKAKTSRVAVTMLAYLIKQKFDNDTFIASKLQFFLHTIYIHNVVGSFLYVTKMADRQERVNFIGLFLKPSRPLINVYSV